MSIARDSNGSPSPPWPVAAALAAGVVAAAFLVFHGSLGYFFSQDDFGWLARARGLLPPPLAPWRFVSARLFFECLDATAGLDSRPYHLTALVAHAAAGVLLLLFLARHVSRPAAWVGAVFFAVHPALFTALYWISAAGDVFALLFGLGAVITARAAGASRWWAVPLFVFALLSKESTLFLPLWIAAYLILAPTRGPGSSAARSGWLPRLGDPLLWTLTLISLAFALWFRAADLPGSSRALPDLAPYAVRYDATLACNLSTYLEWALDAWVPAVRSFADAPAPGLSPYGIAALVLWLAGLAAPGLRRRGWALAGALFLALIFPVLPLRNHTYHYYLYAPLAGAAWLIAALADLAIGVLARRGTPSVKSARGRSPGPGEVRRKSEPEAPEPRPPALAWVLSVSCAALLAVNGALLVRKIETYPFVNPALRSDPTVDRARIARNAYDDLAHHGLPAGSRLWFWSPISIATARATEGTRPGESYWERNVESALYGGMAVRVLFPRVRDARFVGDARPIHAPDLYAVYRLDGHLRVVSGAQLDSLLRNYPETR